MKLSDLVRMADGADPEILVYREDAEYWSVSEAAASAGPGRIVISGQNVLFDWQGEEPNPLTGKKGVSL